MKTRHDPRPYRSPQWRHPSYPSSGSLTPAQPIALARRPLGIVLAALVPTSTFIAASAAAPRAAVVAAPSP